MKEGLLNINLMKKIFGVEEHKLRDTVITDFGTFHHILKVADTQLMSYNAESRGPFYVPDVDKRKYDQFSGNTRYLKKQKNNC